ncbi:MAG: class I SAM-dependent methyltransferase [Planctomycetes bacterium]|nr:class I SAM-dependent methyltransferase [Planctomycetota bacterium]
MRGTGPPRQSRRAEHGADTTTDMTTDELPLSDVSDTGLMTLFCRVRESRSARPILHDPAAEALADRLLPLVAKVDRELPRRLARGKVHPLLAVYLALRTRHYDGIARGFVARHPPGIVVDLGCGMDTRFQRLDDGAITLFDLDLPEMIAVKRRFTAANERHRLLGCSALDHAWLDEVAAVARGPVLFLAEGLFPYFEPAAAKELVLALQRRFPGSELVFETCAARWLSPLIRSVVHFKMRRVGIGRTAVYRFGLRDGREVEDWGPGIRLLGEWSWLDEDEPKIGWLRLLRRWRAVRRSQWAVHCRLG